MSNFVRTPVIAQKVSINFTPYAEANQHIDQTINGVQSQIDGIYNQLNILEEKFLSLAQQKSPQKQCEASGGKHKCSVQVIRTPIVNNTKKCYFKVFEINKEMSASSSPQALPIFQSRLTILEKPMWLNDSFEVSSKNDVAYQIDFYQIDDESSHRVGKIRLHSFIDQKNFIETDKQEIKIEGYTLQVQLETQAGVNARIQKAKQVEIQKLKLQIEELNLRIQNLDKYKDELESTRATKYQISIVKMPNQQGLCLSPTRLQKRNTQLEPIMEKQQTCSQNKKKIIVAKKKSNHMHKVSGIDVLKRISQDEQPDLPQEAWKETQHSSGTGLTKQALKRFNNMQDTAKNGVFKTYGDPKKMKQTNDIDQISVVSCRSQNPDQENDFDTRSKLSVGAMSAGKISSRTSFTSTSKLFFALDHLIGQQNKLYQTPTQVKKGSEIVETMSRLSVFDENPIDNKFAQVQRKESLGISSTGEIEELLDDKHHEPPVERRSSMKINFSSLSMMRIGSQASLYGAFQNLEFDSQKNGGFLQTEYE